MRASGIGSLALALGLTVAFGPAPGRAAEVPTTGVSVKAVNGAADITSADFDGDGDTDFAGVAGIDRSVSWFANPGPETAAAGNWAQTELDGAFTEAVGISHGDLNGDGSPDIVAIAGGLIRDVAFWLNPGPAEAGNANSWDKVVVDGAFTDVIDVHVVDVNLDGNPDIVACATTVGDIQWYENPGPANVGTASQWDDHVIESAFNGIAVLAIGDLDGDGDPDIAGTAASRNAIAWWQNPGPDGDVTRTWSERTDLASNFNGAAGVCIADMDQDGLLDIVAYSGGARQISWWKNPGPDQATTPGAWTKADIPITLQSITDGSPRVLPIDFDSDGDTDLAATSGGNENIVWLDNPLVPSPAGQTEWVRHLIQGQFRGIANLSVGDINGDGAPDLAGAAGLSANEFRWWRNDGPTAPFELVSFEVVAVGDGTTTFALAWSSIAAAPYRVQASDGLGTWSDVAFVVAQGPLTTVDVTVADGAPSRFWRVVRVDGSIN